MIILFIGFVISIIAGVAYPSTITEAMIGFFSIAILINVVIKTFRDLKSI